MIFQDADADEEMRVNMDPMIDCVFLLIIFFLVIKMEQDLAINLPVRSKELKTVQSPAKPIVVNVRYLPGGKAYYHIDNERITLPGMTVNLSRARVRNKDQAVVIRGDRRVKWEHVAAVMNCCADAGIAKVSATVEIGQNT